MSAELRRATLIALAVTACGSPGNPGLPPAGALPPEPAANTCAPALQVARDWFHLADLMSGNSCPVYLEQDECVLGIYADCTVRAGSRQWLGRISADRDLALTAHVGAAASGPTCTGQLSGESERSRFDLACNTGSNQPVSRLVLERRLENPPALGSGGRLVDVAPISGAAFASYDEYMNDVVEVQVGSRRELWFAVDDRGPAPGGLHILDEATQGILGFIELEAVNFVASSGDFVIGLAPNAIVRIDAATRLQAGYTELDGVLAPTALAVASAQNRVLAAFYPGGPNRRVHLESFDLETMEVRARQDELLLNFVPTIAVVPEQEDGTVAFLFGFKPETGAGSVLGINADLEQTRQTELPFGVQSARYIPERGLIGAVAGNRYLELEPADPQAPIRTVIGVPYTENGLDFAFDAARNRIYFLGRTFVPEDPGRYYHLRPSLLTSIDLETEQAEQRVVRINALTRRVIHLQGADAVVVPLQRIGKVEWVDL